MASFRSLKRVILASVSVKEGVNQRRRHPGLPGSGEWGHLYRESSRRSGICSLNMSHSPLRSSFPSQLFPSQRDAAAGPRLRQVITAILFPKSREQSQTQGVPLPLPAAFAQGVKTRVLTPDAQTRSLSLARQVWWHTPGIPALGRLGQEGCRKFKVILVYS